MKTNLKLKQCIVLLALMVGLLASVWRPVTHVIARTGGEAQAIAVNWNQGPTTATTTQGG